jgi:hypothetical protein
VGNEYGNLLRILFASSLVIPAPFSFVFQPHAISIREVSLLRFGFHAAVISNSGERDDKRRAVAYSRPYAASVGQSMPSVVLFVLDQTNAVRPQL